MVAFITVHLQIFKRPQLLCFSTDLDETGINIHVFLRSFISNIVIIRVAVPLKWGPIASRGRSVRLSVKFVDDF